MVTDIRTYRHKQKLAHINELIKQLMLVRSDIQRLKIEEERLKNAIRDLTKELAWSDRPNILRE
ncbi:hypothetical protein [Desulforamulus hydrothermalis]|uniref:Uncharacterized protein n=1 Tax=Desulforamulus hydrothermalis Lam5 = DSM 18033 TaxID=1121428 RepID=K8DX36_9FIRM|nr:hypothetical protein [Desulforamulus hydrothermalis]CCO06985.1 conserved hypothetical protein [Desulforamulus hydrothermalis Lam5 = DSM 18033]SHG98257.1 hypothetical protein SAMN02745177_01001 [Desulforamulus hydrothermalis Lam5 = DSM 18033]